MVPKEIIIEVAGFILSHLEIIADNCIVGRYLDLLFISIVSSHFTIST